MVEKLHLFKRQDSEPCAIPWTKHEFRNAYERWKLVLNLIIKDDGGDRCIEAN